MHHYCWDEKKAVLKKFIPRITSNLVELSRKIRVGGQSGEGLEERCFQMVKIPVCFSEALQST